MIFLNEALSLAESVKGKVSPRPPVGAVIVKDAKIVGKGNTSISPLKHAEIMAIEQAGNMTKGSTMYTSLEPCSHHGSTTPCVKSIVQAGIKKVITPLKDPNPNVNGRGLEKLRSSGIEVSLGAHQDQIRQAEDLIEGFRHFILTNKPFITVKYAMSIDGKISSNTGNSTWISNKESRKIVHKLRSQSDAVLIGVKTLLIDNPKLNARYNFNGPKYRVILDSKSRTPQNSNLVKTPGKILIYCVSKPKVIPENENIEYIITKPTPEGVDIPTVLEDLCERGCVNILIEGGKDILGSFFDLRLVNKVLIFIAPIIVGGQNANTAVGGKGYNHIAQSARLKKFNITRIQDDIMISGYID